MIDASSGARTRGAEAGQRRCAPASLTKIMTAYVVFHALKEGQITLDDEVTVSEKAWRTQGSRMFIEVGKRVSGSKIF